MICLKVLTTWPGRIGDRSGDPEGLGHECFNRFYYFAVAPKYFALGAKFLKEHGLLEPCSEHGRTIRLMIEKPFGADQVSAAALDSSLLEYFTEHQIYRTDHYLGKETVQNMLVLRFANEFLEPIWNRDYVDHVEISMLESDGVGGRGATYDAVGALSDVVQNHLCSCWLLQPWSAQLRMMPNHCVMKNAKF